MPVPVHSIIAPEKLGKEKDTLHKTIQSAKIMIDVCIYVNCSIFTALFLSGTYPVPCSNVENIPVKNNKNIERDITKTRRYKH